MKDERGKMKEDLKIESFLNRMAEKHKANAMKIKEIKFCHSENLCHFVLLSLNKKQKSEQPMWIARLYGRCLRFYPLPPSGYSP